jgi:serine/threonine protein kinase
MAMEALPQGTLIDGRYDIRDRLGQGGMGTVYRARDMKVGQIVALKIMSSGGNESERSKKDRLLRFAREIMAINEVRHPNVLNVQEFGFDKDTPYMVMEFLEGEDLGKIMRERSEPLGVEHAVDISLAICAAIRACHDEEVIHRDLKPGNIMIIKRDFGTGWDVKVVDFGISKTAGTSDLTQDGKIVGTPNFLAPEQITAAVSPASDQYAIGVLLYYCLTKHHPYEGFEALKLIRAIEKGVFPPPREHRPEIPEQLESVILKALRVDPAQRYASVFEFGRQLLEFASPIGRQFWQRYYETPPIVKPKKSAKMSSVGIPLVQRMAEGQIPLSAATVQANYLGTTAVAPAVENTLREGSVPIPIEVGTTNGGPTDVSRTGPSGHDWAGVPPGVEGAQVSRRIAAEERPASSPGRRRAAWIAPGFAVLACVVVIAFGVRRSARPNAAADVAGQPTEHSLPPKPSAAAAPPPLAPPAIVRPAEPSAPSVGGPAAAAGSAQAVPEANEPPKAKHHHHARPAADRASEWSKDPAGNVIPPP